MSAVGVILIAKVAMQATLLAKHLDEHDGKEEYPYYQSLPAPQPQGEPCQIDERTRQHRVAIQAIGAISHQVLCTWSHLMAEGIHGIALAAPLHIDDGPDAQQQSA